MNRLSLYLVRLFTWQALALLSIMLGLLFLVQSLKIFDIVAVQGQNFLTLIGQALLGMPSLAIVLTYVCMGMGMVRALAALQASHELHIIHTNRQLPTLLGAVGLFAIGGAVIVLFLSNIVEPWANRRLDDWSASIAADVVGRTLTPHRFSEVVPNVTIVIGGRQNGGNLTDFMADDSRDPGMRRTYIAKSAKIATDQDGYVLQMHDGSLQYLSADKAFSQVAFKTYNISLNRLTASTGGPDNLAESTTPEILARAFASNSWSPDLERRLFDRLAEGLRVVAMCVFMGALAIFPTGRRGRAWVPLELVALAVAYAGNGISSNMAGPPALAALSGPAAVLVAGLLVLGWRLNLLRPRLRMRPA
ncbi:MAG TPA: LptF/LptG family permease [Devosiaceae bacterium]|nr:LptF/LptG family permease [Devosiaceae bacterium]